MNMGIIGGTAIGFMLGAWKEVRDTIHNITGIFRVRMNVEGPAAYALCMYLNKNAKRVQLGDIDIVGCNEYVRPEERNELVALRSIPRKITHWRIGWRFFTVKRGWARVEVSFFRGMFDPNDFILKAIECFNEEKLGDTRFFICRRQGTIGDKSVIGMFGGDSKGDDDGADRWGDTRNDKYSSTPIGWERDQLGQPQPENAIDMLALHRDAEEAYEQALAWRGGERWYKDRGIPWKLGWLLSGTPGTGKTAFARAVGQSLDMPIFVFDLASMTNKDFVEAWEEMMDWTPCVVLFEDIHATFDRAEKIADTGEEAGMTFDCLLNVLDGVENSDGVLSVITTNHLEKVDPALGGPAENGTCTLRPGRVNRVLSFGSLDMAGKEKIARRVFQGFPDSEWRGLLEMEDATGAQFQDACCLEALSLRESKPKHKSKIIT